MMDKTPAQEIAEVLSRFSVQDLYEQTDANLAKADERFYNSTTDLQVIDQGEAPNFIRWWKVQSGEKEYEVRRFKNFVFCSCAGFFFSKKCCKHVSVTANVYCARCHLLSAKVGKYCYDCDWIMNRFQRKEAA